MIAYYRAPRFSAEFQILLNLLNFPYSLTGQKREREREREAAVSRCANENVHKFKP